MDGLDITVADVPVSQAGHRRLIRVRPPKSFLRRNAKFASFSACVLLPTLIVSIYFFAFAADQYVSEAKFVVRGQGAQAPGMLSSLLQTAGVSRAPDDTYAVQDYILSRDALTELVKTQKLYEVFSRHEADPFSKFPPAFGGDTFEHFYEYYLKHVDVTLDSNTGVSTLTVKTFQPEDSKQIASALLGGAEQLVNRMNGRQRDNTMSDARKEVVLAEQRVQNVATQIAEFRNRESLLDPTKQAVPMLQGINELQTMLSRTNLQIAQLVVSSPNSPLMADYKRRAVALQDQINVANTKITGSDRSLVPRIAEYDMLNLQREFADKQLSSATTSLEMARMQSEHQQIYLDAIVQPNLADYAAYPKRIASIAIVFASFLGIYFMAGLLISGAREHLIS